MQVNTGGTLDLNGRNEGFDVLSGTGTITNTLTSSTSTLTLGESGASSSLTATLQNGAGVTALEKSGTGTLTLTASNSYSGGTTITGGTLSIASNSYLGNAATGVTFSGGTLKTTGSMGSNRPITLNSGGGTMNISSNLFSNAATLGGNITGNGALTMTGPGVLYLAGSNSYTGGTNLNEGSVYLNSVGALGTSGTISFNGGDLNFTAANTTDYSSRFSSAPNQEYRIRTGAQPLALASNISSAGGSFYSSLGSSLTLSGSNSFSGGITHVGGILVLGSSNALGTSGPITIYNTASLQFTAANTNDYSSRITGGSSPRIDTNGQNVTFASNISLNQFFKVGTGTLTLSGTVSVIDFPNVNEGTLQIGSGGFFSSNQLYVNAGSNLLISGGRVSNTSLFLNSSVGSPANVTLNGGSFDATEARLQGGPATSNLNITSGTFRSQELHLGATINLSGGLLTATNAYVQNGVANVSGGTWTNANLYFGDNGASGTLNLTSGTVSTPTMIFGRNGGQGTANVSGGLLTSATSMILGLSSGGSGTLTISGGAVTAPSLTVGNFLGSGTVSLSAGTLTASSSIYVGYSASVGGSLTITGGTATTPYLQAGFEGGRGSVNVSGGVLNAGYLTIGQSANDCSLTLSGGTLNSTSGLIGGNGGAVAGTLANISGGTWQISGDLNTGLSNQPTIINMTGGTVNAANAYLGSGTTTISGGALMLSSTLALGRGFTDATLAVTGSGNVMVASGTGIFQLGINSTYNATLNLGTGGTAGALNVSEIQSSGTDAARVVNFNHTGNYTFAPKLSGVLSVNKLGAGTTLLAGSNSYTGPTMISAGTLQFGKRAALYASGTASWTAANFTTGTGATAAFNVGGAGEFTASDIALLATLGTGTSGFRSGANLGLDTTNATSGTFAYASAIANPNAGANALGFTKLGAGTLLINGSHSYTGPTMVRTGKLLVNGTLAAGSAITVQSGGQLGGRGKVGAITVASGGSTYPGDPQVLTATSVAYQNGSSAQFALYTSGTSIHPPVVGSDYDRIALTGGTPSVLQIAMNTALQLNLTSQSLNYLQEHAGENALDNYFLFALGNGTSIGAFSTLTLTQGLDTYTQPILAGEATFTALNIIFHIGYTGNSLANSLTGGNDITLTAMVIPEPATATLLMLGGLGYFAKAKRRKKALIK